MRIKIYQKRIYREDLKANPEVFYLFGDNLHQVGMGGQAGEMRNEPNAVGVPTKRIPGMSDGDFFSDNEFSTNCGAVDAALAKIPADAIVIIPSDGLGTGLAELDKRAPRTFEYLQNVIEAL